MTQPGINATPSISPSQRLGADEARQRVARGPETGRMEADQAAFAYPGVQIPDFKEARDWKPGKKGMNGTQANQMITGIYTQLDGGMSAYLGEPAVANWSTFGKFASQNAGNQISRLEALERTTKGKSLTALTSLAADAIWNPNDTRKNFQALKDAKLEGYGFLDKAYLLRKTLVNGNTAIIRDIAPSFDVFLRAESAGKDGVAALRAAGFGREPLDPHGLIIQAFEKYAEARRLGDKIQSYPPHLVRLLNPDLSKDATTEDFKPAEVWKQLEADDQSRRQLVFQANLLLGFQEQLVSLQTPEVFGNPDVAKLMGSLSRGMAFNDARGSTRLLPSGGNWADFTTRMGLKELPDGQVPTENADLVITLRHPDGGERRYVTSGLCQPGNITNYMVHGSMDASFDTMRMIGTRPEDLSKFYTHNPVFRALSPLRSVGGWLSGLKRRLIG